MAKPKESKRSVLYQKSKFVPRRFSSLQYGEVASWNEKELGKYAAEFGISVYYKEPGPGKYAEANITDKFINIGSSMHPFRSVRSLFLHEMGHFLWEEMGIKAQKKFSEDFVLDEEGFADLYSGWGLGQMEYLRDQFATIANLPMTRVYSVSPHSSRKQIKVVNDAVSQIAQSLKRRR